MRDRSTERLANGGVGYSNGEYFRVCYPWNDHCLTDIDRIAIKLCDLEDKIEQGKIVEMPCKVGDTIYFVSRGEIIPMVVNCISFNGNYQYCLNCHYADEEQYGYSLLTFTDKVRGYMFGFTREEAEKELAEGSENGK